MNNPIRTISEILTDADKATTYKELDQLRLEIRANLKKYPLVQLRFAYEYLIDMTGKIRMKEKSVLDSLIREFFEGLND